MTGSQHDRWGPSYQGQRHNSGGSPLWFRCWMVGLGWWWITDHPTIISGLILIGGGFLVALVVQVVLDGLKERGTVTARIANAVNPLSEMIFECQRSGGGAYLGVGEDDAWRFARRERAVLLLGPPRSGKSSAVIIPALIAHYGPAVSTSTKPDVLAATLPVRSRFGQVWQFDPTHTNHHPAARQLRWSPVSASESWDGALLMARAMVGTGVGSGTTDSSHWSKRATALLAPLLHAAALSDQGVDAVVGWVMRHELDEPGTLLEQTGSRLGVEVLSGLANTEARELSRPSSRTGSTTRTC
jgi:type IV secretory pathway TraG/TraD family ATPase VirD4